MVLFLRTGQQLGRYRAQARMPVTVDPSWSLSGYCAFALYLDSLHVSFWARRSSRKSGSGWSAAGRSAHGNFWRMFVVTLAVFLPFVVA